MENRICKVCNQSKVISKSFHLMKTINDKKYYRCVCKDCWNKDRKRKETKHVREWFISYKKSLICSVCSYSDHRAIQFHHRDPSLKKFEIGCAINKGYSKKYIEEEIKKCDVLCANCHSIKHYNCKE